MKRQHQVEGEVRWTPDEGEIQHLRDTLEQRRQPKFPEINEALAKKRKGEKEQAELLATVG